MAIAVPSAVVSLADSVHHHEIYLPIPSLLPLHRYAVVHAEHSVQAYRIVVPGSGSILQDNDEDGESAAGGRLLHMMEMMGAENVVSICLQLHLRCGLGGTDVRPQIAVVSRWYGGIQLGPDRFKHINHVAQALLVELGYDVRAQKRDEGGKKKKKKDKK